MIKDRIPPNSLVEPLVEPDNDNLRGVATLSQWRGLEQDTDDEQALLVRWVCKSVCQSTLNPCVLRTKNGLMSP